MRLVVAAGGTGGHLFPGIAVAERLKSLDPQGEVIFVGSEKSLEEEILARQGFCRESLPVGRLKGEGLKGVLKTVMTLPTSGWKAFELIKRLKPHVVLGIGGYSSGPLVGAAFLKNIPRAILEPNSIPGLTNRLLQVVSNRVFISFPETARFFSPRKTFMTGTPVRKGLTDIGQRRGAINRASTKIFTILVLGGSQGASTLNDEMIHVLPFLKKETGGKMKIIHQTGAKDYEELQKVYRAFNVEARVEAFIDDMSSVYEEADIAVSRAGASTIAELIETALPSILVPYPHAADDHQRFNALSIQEEGGAEMMLNQDLPRRLGPALVHYFHHLEELETMQKSLAGMRKAPAAEVVARECLKLAQ